MKIMRLYRKNRKLVWLWIIIAIFCIAIINLVNSAYEEQAQKNSLDYYEKIQEVKERKSPSNVVDYDKAAQSLTTSGSVDKEIRDEVQQVLEKFIKCVTSGQIEQAYELLTEQCKEIKYPSIEFFEDKYCKDLSQKIYSFQSWSSTRSLYVYQVRFYRDMLSIGIDTTQHYLQDYITVQKKGEQYKLNIDSLIDVKTIDKEKEENQIKVNVKNVETYLDYEIYEIEITNNRLKEIILDTRQKDDTLYVKNNDGLKIQSLIYENKEEDLIVAPGEVKTIKIKFNNTYNGEKNIICVGFSDIVIDEENNANEKMGLEIYLR